MSKAIMLSIQPKWCELIASGEKTIEIRKTSPKLEVPFKCYIYQTKKKWIYRLLKKLGLYQGKVIGEFICDRIYKYSAEIIACAKFEVNGAEVDEKLRYNAGACLDAEAMFSYNNGKDLYGLHISDLKIYDKPKELGEFRKPDFYRDCKTCDELEYLRCPTKDSRNADILAGYCRRKGEQLTRPFQCWGYVNF